MLDAYRVLFRPPGTTRLVLSLLVGRIPIGIFGLAILLLVREETGSYAQGGLAGGAWAVGASVASPIQGRLVDRFGQPAVLIPSTLVNAFAVIGVIACAREQAPSWTLAFFAFLGGAGLPPLAACMRSIWADVFAGDVDARNTAYTFEGVVSEAFFVIGPVVTAGVVALVDTTAALLLAVALSLAGTFGFVTGERSRAWRSPPTRRTAAGALRSPGMRAMMLAILPTGMVLGALDVAMPAFAESHGKAREFGGVFLAAMSLSSVAGGIWYGARTWSSTVVNRFVVLHVLMAVSTLPLLLADSIPVMVVAMVIAGLALAPSAAAGYLLIDHVSPPGTTTEATTWMMTSNVAGFAAGSALAGVIVEHASVRWGLVLACGGPIVGALISVLLRGKLHPAYEEEHAAADAAAVAAAAERETDRVP